MDLAQEELRRYSRQMMIPEIGEEGQRKLKKAKVLVAGIGGLGSISSTYLAAAGIGHLTIIDKDRVESSNLNRQLIHGTNDIGEWKTDSAIRKLRHLNPNCSIRAIQAEITEDNCQELIGDCSVIVDGMDNMKTRRILNAASIRNKIPYIFGSVNQLDGLASVFMPQETPCLECVFPFDADESDSVSPGILGPVPGVIACIQSIEVVKLILGFKDLLAGRLLCFCGHDMTFQELQIKRNPQCPVCSA
jgi:molybdopterin/thiamine biosynthesis adenylyltransferase